MQEQNNTAKPTTKKLRKIVVIEPTVKKAGKDATSESKKLRVAAYARVSTEQEEQQNSYATQIKYYTDFIQQHDNWEFVGIYADEGITGTNTKKRDSFNRMIKDAKDGKIDLILTKSVSRFARNTVDVLTNVRELKNLGVEIWFERENIHTLDPTGETILTIMGSISQEEARNISENVRWGKRKLMKEGKFSLNYSNFLGYQKGSDGRPEIVEEEAQIVRTIFNWFLDGISISRIAGKLEAMGAKTATGNAKWHPSSIKRILENEKYKGDALLQKTYTEDYLTKKVKINHGELERYYIHNSHAAIIDPDLFDLAQYELARRSHLKQKLKSANPLATKIVCLHCGGFYGHKVFRNKKDGSRYDLWACNARARNKDNCNAPYIKQVDIEKAFSKTLKVAIQDPEKNTINEEENQKIREKLDANLIKAEDELDAANHKLKQFTDSLDKRFGVPESCLETHEALVKAQETASKAYEKANEAIVLDTSRKAKQKRFITTTAELSPDDITFSEILFTRTVEKIEVETNNLGIPNLHFHFLNGSIVTAEIIK